MPTTTETAAPRTAPLALWRVAEVFLRALFMLFGSPEEIAQRHTLTHTAYALMLSWLRAGEAMMRRLIAIEAASFAKPNTPPYLRPTRQRARRAVEFWPDKPEAWRVSFRCLSDRRRLASVRTRSPSKAQRFHDAWPLALRYEALLRAFNDPTPSARRVAKRLHANPPRLAELLRAPPSYLHRVDQSAELTAAATAAWRTVDSS